MTRPFIKEDPFTVPSPPPFAINWGMPMIRLAKSGREISVPAGAPLMKALLDAGVPVASSCNGDAVCGKCVLRVVQGAEGLAAPGEDENFLHETLGLKTDQRISCQTLVIGDVTVDAGYW